MKDYGVRADRVRVVPGGVDAARYDRPRPTSEAKALLGWPQDRPVVVAVRRLAQRMGLDNLIRAMPEVTRRVPEALLMIAGRGPQRSELDAQVAALGLADNVRFLGFIADDDLPLVYRAADIAVMPSRELEGFGLTAVEALAAGTPVLVTPVGGLTGGGPWPRSGLGAAGLRAAAPRARHRSSLDGRGTAAGSRPMYGVRAQHLRLADHRPCRGGGLSGDSLNPGAGTPHALTER